MRSVVWLGVGASAAVLVGMAPGCGDNSSLFDPSLAKPAVTGAGGHAAGASGTGGGTSATGGNGGAGATSGSGGVAGTDGLGGSGGMAGTDGTAGTAGAGGVDGTGGGPPCEQPGASCSSAPCCQPFQCNAPGQLCGAALGCPNYGEKCTDDNGCCSDLYCGPQGFCIQGPKPCGEQGASCAGDWECCANSGLSCLLNKCQPMSVCHKTNEACGSLDPTPCCGALSCIGDTCIEPTCPEPGDSCGNCVAKHCCGEWLKCSSDANCLSAVDCVKKNCGPNDLVCVANCMQSYSSSATQPFLQCVSTQCKPQC